MIIIKVNDINFDKDNTYTNIIIYNKSSFCLKSKLAFISYIFHTKKGYIRQKF